MAVRAAPDALMPGDGCSRPPAGAAPAPARDYSVDKKNSCHRPTTSQEASLTGLHKFVGLFE